MHVFDGRCLPTLELVGSYHGLTEGENGDIYTMSDNKIVKFVFVDGKYKFEDEIQLSAVNEFEERRHLSKPRYLVYSKGRIHISDMGLHKLLLVDLNTGKQTATGYFGEGKGQFKCPAGMVADRDGNLLLLDQGNNRVLVYTSSGNWVKVVASGQQEGLEQPCSIFMHMNSVLVTFMGESGRGGVVRFSLGE
jgi:hypothetical protein